jgi:hypothetical protein
MTFITVSFCVFNEFCPGNLTGEDARPTLWRGRPRPRFGQKANCFLATEPALQAGSDAADIT